MQPLRVTLQAEREGYTETGKLDLHADDMQFHIEADEQNVNLYSKIGGLTK